MTRWEYCSLGPIKARINSPVVGHYPALSFFTERGVKKESVETRNRDNRDDISIVIANLGGDGWELVGAGSVPAEGHGSFHILYFKRPISN